MTTAMIQVFTLTTADGEARAARVCPDGSYGCPFCSGAVLSRESWEANEANNAAVYARTGEAYSVQPYPVNMARTYDVRGCGNPACDVNAPTDVLAATRKRRAERQAESERQARITESLKRSAQESRDRDATLWAELRGKAEAAGQCVSCLRASYWQTRPKFTRHRDAANCPQARKYA